ncbi:alkaline ceramidase [Exaiptasia diaphana]|uniref:Alkaline ceramidase n=1 Tax=Exaiptasia diaphana TaxID=2652724 RepID=A0A913XID2_EXADI|nr:alkaline ceramidase [Exaiptasia diaphana]KXJ26016.1 Alkaline ceramidase 2 [Exaiptasia diaphana]
MLAHFERGSSEIDWCEANYEFSHSIAEFYNTISNVVFLVIPPFFMYLFRPYSAHIGQGINLIFFLLVVIGVCSAYFHATLSLVGQLLDELAILWVIMAAFAMWAPKWIIRICPFYGNRHRLVYLMVLFGVFGTLLGFIHPIVNAFALLSLGPPLVSLLVYEVMGSPNKVVHRLGFFCTFLWITAIACWINDRVFCETWKSLSFPYLHCGWHILIFVASYLACVIAAYIHAVNEFPQYKPSIIYWPDNSYQLGFPYVTVKVENGKDLLA